MECSIQEVNISDIKDNTYFANIVLNTSQGFVTLTSRPSDAIAIALRSNINVTVNEDVFINNCIDILYDNIDEIEEFKNFIDTIKPEDFT